LGLLIGLGAGLFGGLLGIGGGFIMIPLMVRFMRVRQHVAHGTSLAVLVFIGLSGALSYALKGSLDIAAFLLLAATSVVTAYFGARVAHALPEQLLKRFFGAFLLFVAIFMLLKPHLWSAAFAPALRYRVVVLAGAGVLTGFISGMLGVGGGAVMVPAMVLLLGMDQYTAQGTSLLTMVPMGFAGAWTHFRLGNVKARLIGQLVTGVIAGSFLGGTFAHLFPENALRSLFGIVLVWTAWRYLAPGRWVGEGGTNADK
jgi:uncharacterized membrane protein YfcA